VKPDDVESTERRSARERWRYMPTDTCRRWFRALQDERSGSTAFLWEGFARACLIAFDIRPYGGDGTPDTAKISEYAWRAYQHIHRRAGPNPLDSVALYAMILAVTEGVRIEMAEFHRLLLDIKQQNLLPDHAFFASGND